MRNQSSPYYAEFVIKGSSRIMKKHTKKANLSVVHIVTRSLSRMLVLTRIRSELTGNTETTLVES